MPLHLEGICKNGIAPEAVSETVEELYNTPTSSFSSINRFYHLRTEMVDENTGDTIGHFVLSVIRNEKADRNDVVDTDLSFKSAEPVRLWFEQMAGPTVYGSQGYEAITLDDDIDEQYLYLETVNRYGLPEPQHPRSGRVHLRVPHGSGHVRLHGGPQRRHGKGVHRPVH